MTQKRIHEGEKSRIAFTDEDGYERIPNRVLRCPDIKAGPKILLLDLMSYCHGDGKRRCWPSQERLARELGVGQRTIHNWLDDLKAAGLVDVNQRGLGQTNVYTIADRCFPDRKSPSGPDQNETTILDQQAPSVPVGSQLPTNTTIEHNKRTLQHQHGNNGGGEGHTFSLTDNDTIVQDLRDIGMNNAQDIANRYDNDKIRRWVDYVEGPQADSIRNPAGFVRNQLRNGHEPPQTKPDEPEMEVIG